VFYVGSEESRILQQGWHFDDKMRTPSYCIPISVQMQFSLDLLTFEQLTTGMEANDEIACIHELCCDSASERLHH
jgi:hypothetical protein